MGHMNIDKKKIAIALALILVLAGAFLFYKKRNNDTEKKLSGLQSEQSVAESQENVEKAENMEEKAENPPAEKAEEKVINTNNNQEESNGAALAKVNDKEEEKKEEGGSEKASVNNKLVGWGYEDASGRKVDTIVIHSSYNSLGGDKYSLSKILDIYKSYGVAAHYIIDRKGSIYRLVKDEDIAYHAGESKVPDGRKGVNNFSIGIEMIADKEEGCTKDQYSSLKSLLANLKDKYSIKYVLGHKDIAPGRKDDPWNFDWGKIK